MAAYGPQGIPTGLPAGPGWPRRNSNASVNADTSGFPAQYFLVRADQQIRIPAWAKFMRLGATGTGGNGRNGGGGSTAGGAGGGGFAGTNTVKAVPNAVINVRFDTVGTIIDAPGYFLIGGRGGDGQQSVIGTAGIGTGGDINFSGGTGGLSTNTSTNGGGGGAAGRGGPGVAGANNSNSGGNGGIGTGYLGGSAPGGGEGASGQVGTSASAATVGSIRLTMGQQGANATGGDGGGGGGGTNTGQSTQGGNGLALIEFW